MKILHEKMKILRLKKYDCWRCSRRTYPSARPKLARRRRPRAAKKPRSRCARALVFLTYSLRFLTFLDVFIQAEEKRLADEAVAARRSGLRKTSASDAMVDGTAGTVATLEDSAQVQAERQAVAAKKLQSRFKSLEKSITVSFQLKDLRFSLKNLRFLFKNLRFVLKNLHFPLNNLRCFYHQEKEQERKHLEEEAALAGFAVRFYAKVDG